MNNNKQTAVEWLKIKYKQQGMLFDKDLQQAKEMEKQQSIDFARHCLHKANREFELDILTSFIDVHQYYNETFGGNK